jgi:hypothetical protein
VTSRSRPCPSTRCRCRTYNLGFLAVSRHPSLATFLTWWKDKLEFRCVVDIERGLFVDQKWMDLAPGLFDDVAILRHAGYNVAYWNLRQRAMVVEDGGQIAVNGQPLRFFHFSGVDPALQQMPDLFGSSAHNIGCWHWELPELPDAWIASARPLDEIWAPSAFICRHYHAGGQWAEPDIDHAAHFLRRLVDDDGWREQLGARARHTIGLQFSAEAAGLRYRQRLARLA